MPLPHRKQGQLCCPGMDSRSLDDRANASLLSTLRLSVCDCQRVRTSVCAARGRQLQRRESASWVGPAPCSCDSIAGLAWLPDDFAGTSSARSSCEIYSGLGWRPASSSYKVHTAEGIKQQLEHPNICVVLLHRTISSYQSHIRLMKNGRITFKAIHVSLWKKEGGDEGTPNTVLLPTRVKRIGIQDNTSWVVSLPVCTFYNSAE